MVIRVFFFLSSRRRHTRCALVTGVQTCALPISDFQGEARAQPDIKIGYLEQEPRLNPEHNVREAVEEGVGEVLTAQAELDKVYAAYGEPDADFDKLAAAQARLEAILATNDAHLLEQQLEVAADALRLPPWDEIGRAHV